MCFSVSLDGDYREGEYVCGSFKIRVISWGKHRCAMDAGKGRGRVVRKTIHTHETRAHTSTPRVSMKLLPITPITNASIDKRIEGCGLGDEDVSSRQSSRLKSFQKTFSSFYSILICYRCYSKKGKSYRKMKLKKFPFYL